jgi:hypothetical protein
MQAYGRKKGHTHVEGHQECGICHPVQKNKVKRARRTNKQAISEESEPVSEPSDS